MRYDPWQQQILDAKGHVLLNKGRQIGGTEIFAHKAAEYIINNPKHQIICVSLTLDQAENIITMVHNYLHTNYKNSILKGKKYSATKTRIWVKGGGHIISRPVGTTGDAVRTFTGNILYADEASRLPRAFWIAAKAILFTTAGSIWMSSTPAGKFDNKEFTYYYSAFLNKYKRFTVIEQNSEWVAANRPVCETWTQEQKDGALQLLKEERESMSSSEYAQEYLGQFMDDIQQWFPDDLIRQQMTEARPGKIIKGVEYYLGVDVARMGEDQSTFEIFEKRGEHLYQVENQVTTKTKLPDTYNHIVSLHRQYDFTKILIDSQGIGVGVYDWLMENDDTKNITIPIDNSVLVKMPDNKTSKRQKTLKYSWFKMMMETNRIHLLDEDKVFQSFKSTQYAYTTDNFGVRHLKIFGNYTHIAEGCANAVWGGKHKDLNPKVYTIKI